MSPAFHEYRKLLTELERLIADEQGDSEQADALRDRMDAPWNEMTDQERTTLETDVNVRTNVMPESHQSWQITNVSGFGNLLAPTLAMGAIVSLIVIGICKVAVSPVPEQPQPASLHSSTRYVDHSTMNTAIHDGHWFVIRGHTGILHHPDCPCLSPRNEVTP